MRLATFGGSILITTASLFASVPAANATDVIFDDIGSGYQTGGGFTISGPESIVGAASVAFTFTAPHNDVISEIKLGMEYGSGDGLVDLALYTDVGGHFGTKLKTTQLPVLNDGSSTTETVNWGDLNVPVVGGDSYFIFAQPSSDPFDFVSWDFNAEGLNFPDGTPYPAYTVLGGGMSAGVPETSTWVLGILGLALLGVALRQRRQPEFG